ncbi:MAG TPA: anti-sigma factor [Acidimicrobiia bacterium]|nr:anti-sigma factor [Acidimicrobiia bacterium]
MSSSEPSLPRRLAGIGVGVTASVAAVSVVVAVVAVGEPDLEERIRSAADVATHDVSAVGPGRATVVYSREVGRALLVVEGLPAPEPGEVYQLWVVDDGRSRRAGTFVPEADGATVIVEGTVEVGDEIGVTLEPGDGSDRPSGEFLVSVTLP